MKIFLIAVLSVALSTSAAMAQDADWRSGLYVKGGAGWNSSKDERYVGRQTDLKSGYAATAAIGASYGVVGVPFGTWRSELEASYRRNDADKHINTFGTQLTGVDGTVSSAAVMANQYFDVDTGTPIHPYIGGGIGVAHVSLSNYRGSGVEFLDQSDNVFAYQGMAGVEYSLDDAFDLFTEYKFFATEDVSLGTNVTTNYKNHSVLAGVKYNLY